MLKQLEGTAGECQAGFQPGDLVKPQDLELSIQVQGVHCSYLLGRMMTGLAEEQAGSWNL